MPVNLITVQEAIACEVSLIYAAHAKVCVVFVCKNRRLLWNKTTT